MIIANIYRLTIARLLIWLIEGVNKKVIIIPIEVYSLLGGNIITFFMKFYNCMKFFKEISNAFTEWVSSPEEIKSTPDNA